MNSDIKTTSLRIRPQLHAKVRKMAEAAGTSPHNFMLAAIEEKAKNAELQQEFHAEAERRMQRIAATGKGLSWPEMKKYLENRAAGRKSRLPGAKKIADL